LGQVRPGDVDDDIEQMRKGLEEIIHEWEDKLGTVPDRQRGLLDFMADLNQQWRRCRRKSIQGDEFQEQDRRRESRPRSEQRQERRGLLAKFKRGCSKIPDLFDFAWMIFDHYIDIVADRMAR